MIFYIIIYAIQAGTPGVCAWRVAGSCSAEERLMLPPRISNRSGA